VKRACDHCCAPVEQGERCDCTPAPRRSVERNTGNRAYRRARKLVLERDGYTCQYCGGPANEADHVVPVALGGTRDPDQMVACCGDCNKRKGASL